MNLQIKALTASLAMLALNLPLLRAATAVTGPGAGVEGNAEYGEPMSGNATFQYIILGSDLTVLQNQTITGIAFRSDSTYDPGAPAYGFASLKITVGSTLASALVSTTFADNNVGAITTYNGAFYYDTSLPSGGSPNAFGQYINFHTPFAYSTGNLVITLSHTSNVKQSDGTSSTWPGTADAYSNTTGVLNAGIYNASSGAFLGVTPVTALTTSAIPEPSTYAGLAGIGVMLFAAYCKRR